MKQWFRFIFSRAFVRTVLRLGLVWVILLGAVWMYLKVYTQPGATRTMPALKGLTLIEAQLSLEAEGLIPIHLDSIYSRKGRAFEVIEQVPPADSQIKTGRRVYLTTYRSTPPFESLDITEGQDMGIAKILLVNKGFEVEEKFEPNIALVGRVIRMETAKGRVLAASDRLPKGTSVWLVSGDDYAGFGGCTGYPGLEPRRGSEIINRSSVEFGFGRIHGIRRRWLGFAQSEGH